MKKIILVLVFVLLAGLCSASSVMAEQAKKKFDYSGLNVNSSASLRDSKEVAIRALERNYDNLSPEKKAGPIGISILEQKAEIEKRFDQKIKAAEEAEAEYYRLKNKK